MSLPLCRESLSLILVQSDFYVTFSDKVYFTCYRVASANHYENTDDSPIYVNNRDIDFVWHYFDCEYKTEDVLDNIDAMWYGIGTFPFGDDIKRKTEQTVSLTYTGHLSSTDFNTGDEGKFLAIITAHTSHNL